MTADTAAARKARAEHLHRQIESLKTRRNATNSDAEAESTNVPPGGETPAEFVHRKMREQRTGKK